ncbi:MAG TPA: glycosyltransferase family 2 protein [Polyangiaceae bacterium]|jgi:glycosyltransferase involved in cell wall biosynthesis|nr:glycosyltransferase family 2 protein [Polyangiaceae bacterium]
MNALQPNALHVPESWPSPALAVDPEVRLHVPADDVASPELSIVVPALNEELTIGEFVEWCKEGLRKAKVVGEVLIVDSSTDSTAEIALSKGARVLKTPKRGLGRAYIDSFGFIRGKYVLMGDSDCTYDFRELEPFVAKFREGVEFIMGSRFRGYIEPGSMPPLHRYLGTPVTTWILNVLFSSHFSDIHCGMRGITRSALERMGLRSQSWEYASEMVLKSVHMKLKTDQVPIRFLKDREGRLSHHKRSGWLSPWIAAWINLRAMFVYGADFFLYRPGFVITAVGALLTLPLSFGAVRIGSVEFSLHWMLLGLTLVTLGLQCVYLGILTQVFFDYTGEATKRWFNRFRYTRTVLAAALLFLTGLTLTGSLCAYYVSHHFLLVQEAPVNYLGVTGLLLMIVGFMTFTFTLLLHSTAVVVWRR